VSRLLYVAAAASALSFAGCYESDIDPMMRQEKYKAYAETPFYEDGRAMRLPPKDTVPRERVIGEEAINSPPLTQALLERGRDRYDIYCAVCHGYAGDGDSVVASKMSLRAPPTFHDDRLRAYSPGQIFNAITEGYGYMPTYAAEVPTADRWAIANYVKALQLSQHVAANDVPADKRGSLDTPAAPPKEGPHAGAEPSTPSANPPAEGNTATHPTGSKEQ
jgi:mono/diheme cytochrome c family protein